MYRTVSKPKVATILTNTMVKVTSTWINQCCLQLNVSKTVFTKTYNSSEDAGILVSEEFKYLCIILNSHVKQICKGLQFNLTDFRFIRSVMSTQTAKM